MSMYTVRNSRMAELIAYEHCLMYGMSALDGRWHVGTRDQLEAIGCVEVLCPAPIVLSHEVS